MAATATIELFGVKYHQSHAAAMKPLAPDELKNLEISIQKHGIKQEITVVPHRPLNEDGTQGEVVKGEFDLVDGWNRLKTAKKLSLAKDKVPIQVEPADTPLAALRAMAIALNFARRQLSRADKVKSVKELKALGYSYRQIAAKAGITRATAQRMATDTNSKGKGGANGKAKLADRPPAAEAQADRVGQKLPNKALREVFSDGVWFGTVNDNIQTVKTRLDQIAGLPSGVGQLLKVGELVRQLGAIGDAVEGARPYAVCPKCGGGGEAVKGCTVCHSRGWLTQQAFRVLPQDLREKVMEASQSAAREKKEPAKETAAAK